MPELDGEPLVVAYLTQADVEAMNYVASARFEEVSFDGFFYDEDD